ncbi:unnamed protein product [Cuscuta campestris]|uniref:Uncharacterized protein n=1 Tax=Cuscuta campestris TaxID=132261 RepID=A0A484L966_9ASTE|nr:unnamed protein product [Cuscuta campestris]
MASIDRCSVSVSCCCCRITEWSTVALERSSTATVPSADCLDDVAVHSSATDVRPFATAMTDEQPRKMFSPEEEDNHERGTSLFPNFDNLTPEQWNAVRHVFSLSPFVSSMKFSSIPVSPCWIIDTGTSNHMTSDISLLHDVVGISSCASLDTGSTNEVSSYDEYEELRMEEQMDNSRRNGRPEESGRTDRLQTVDLMDRSDVHGRPSESGNTKDNDDIRLARRASTVMEKPIDPGQN